MTKKIGQKRDQRRERTADERGEQQAVDIRCPARVREALRPQEDERLLLPTHAPSGKEEVFAVDRHRAVGGLALRQSDPRTLRQNRRVVQEALVLPCQVRKELVEVRSHDDAGALAAGDEVCLM